MKKQKTDFYEKYWKRRKDQFKQSNKFLRGIKRLTSSEPIFDEVPVWGSIKEVLNERRDFFDVSIKGRILDAGCGLGEWVFYIS